MAKKKTNPETDDALMSRLFPGFRPRNPVESEMAKRYIVWFKLFAKESAIVEREGSTIEHGNGTAGPSPHFSNMRHSEGEMKRLWKELHKAVDDAAVDTRVVKGFEGL